MSSSHRVIVFHRKKTVPLRPERFHKPNAHDPRHIVPLRRSAPRDAGGEEVAGHRENLADGDFVHHRAGCRERRHCREGAQLCVREHLQHGRPDFHPADALRLRLPEMVGDDGAQGIPHGIGQHLGRQHLGLLHVPVPGGGVGCQS